MQKLDIFVSEDEIFWKLELRTLFCKWQPYHLCTKIIKTEIENFVMKYSIILLNQFRRNAFFSPLECMLI